MSLYDNVRSAARAGTSYRINRPRNCFSVQLRETVEKARGFLDTDEYSRTGKLLSRQTSLETRTNSDYRFKFKFKLEQEQYTLLANFWLDKLYILNDITLRWWENSAGFFFKRISFLNFPLLVNLRYKIHCYYLTIYSFCLYRIFHFCY